MREKIGIVGYGRMGHALAAQLKKYYEVLVCDIKKGIKREPGVELVSAKTLFSECRYILLCVNQEAIELVVTEHMDYTKVGTYLINIATDYQTERLRTVVGREREIEVVDAKIMGQYLAIEKGLPVVVFTEEQEEEKTAVIQFIFSHFAEVMTGDSRIVGAVNHEITKRAVRMVLAAYRYCEEQGMPNEIYKIVVKAVAAGTIAEFDQSTDNGYLTKIIEEIRKGE